MDLAQYEAKMKDEWEAEKEAHRLRNLAVSTFLTRWGVSKEQTVDLAVRLRRVYDRTKKKLRQ